MDAGLMLGSCCGPVIRDIHMTPKSTDSRPGTDTGPGLTGAYLLYFIWPLPNTLTAALLHHYKYLEAAWQHLKAASWECVSSLE